MHTVVIDPKDDEIQAARAWLPGGPEAYCNRHTWQYKHTLVMSEDALMHCFTHGCHPEDLEPRFHSVPASIAWTIRRRISLSLEELKRRGELPASEDEDFPLSVA